MSFRYQHAKIVIIGGGTSGCAAARQALLNSDAEVVLLEAGPDYGTFTDHNWPPELLDTRWIPSTHDAGLHSRDSSGRVYPVERARVLGGCSAHNGCSAVRGTRRDFRHWELATGGLFSSQRVEDDYAAIESLLRVRAVTLEESSPFQRHVLAATLSMGWPESRNINDLDEDEGVSLCPVNKNGSIRWNAAFAFLDDIRQHPRLRIIDHVEIDRLLLQGQTVNAIQGQRAGKSFVIEGSAFILAAGAYGSPIILQRSGIGDSDILSQAGIAPLIESTGVGKNLQDHPCAVLSFSGSQELIREMQAHELQRPLFEEGVIAKMRSSYAQDNFDLHIFTSGGHTPHDADEWYWQFHVGLMQERSRGTVLVDKNSKGKTFTISHNHFSDQEGLDIACVLDGIAMTRKLISQSKLSALLPEELSPSLKHSTREALTDWLQSNYLHYWHPAGSCRMGVNLAAGDVCNGHGAIFGLNNAYIADASLMPTITAANTNLPAALLGWRVGCIAAAAV